MGRSYDPYPCMQKTQASMAFERAVVARRAFSCGKYVREASHGASGSVHRKCSPQLRLPEIQSHCHIRASLRARWPRCHTKHGKRWHPTRWQSPCRHIRASPQRQSDIALFRSAVLICNGFTLFLFRGARAMRSLISGGYAFGVHPALSRGGCRCGVAIYCDRHIYPALRKSSTRRTAIAFSRRRRRAAGKVRG